MILPYTLARQAANMRQAAISSKNNGRHMLFSKIHGTSLAYDSYANLPWVSKIFFYFFCNVLAEHIGGVVVHIIGIDNNANLAPGLNGIRLGHCLLYTSRCV
ncbi:hypothetical protein R80B4_02562 [Fibrobacteres bacterium R8-0-B4]